MNRYVFSIIYLFKHVFSIIHGIILINIILYLPINMRLREQQQAKLDLLTWDFIRVTHIHRQDNHQDIRVLYRQNKNYTD